MTKGKTKIFFASLILSLFLMFFAFRNVDLQNSKSFFNNFDFKVMIPSFFIVILMYVVHGLRWANISSEMNLDKSKNYVLITFLGFAVNSIVPMRMGDMFKIFISKKYLQKEYSQITSTVLFAQYLDFVFVLFCFAIILLFLPELYSDELNTNLVNQNTYIVLIMMFFVALFIVFSLPYISRILIYVKKNITLENGSILLKILNYLLRVSETLQELSKDYSRVFKNFCLTFLYWFLILSLFMIIAHGFDINIPIRILIFSILLSNLASIFPLTPSSIGTFHVSLMFGLLLWTDDQNISFVYATTVHGLIFLSNIILGVISTIILNLKLREKLY